MPDLSKLPVPKYDPLHPYHWEYDNVPIEVLALRDQLINGELENHAEILRDASGNQGTISNRLNQSLEEDGSLKDSAIDEAVHNIAEHSDGSKTVSDEDLEYYNDTLGYTVEQPVSFVRMLEAERSKLTLIASEATNIRFEVETDSDSLIIEEGQIYLGASESIQWDVTAPVPPSNAVTIKPVYNKPAHSHYYDIEPIIDEDDDDNLNYKVNSLSTPYKEGSLRVYINGVKLTADAEIHVPKRLDDNGLGTDADWVLNSFTPDHAAGTFELTTAIAENDIIRVDFDVVLT